jgi:hypothetical protein
MSAGHYRLVLNIPPDNAYRTGDMFLGREGEEGVITHIQQIFGLEKKGRQKNRRFLHSIEEYTKRGITYKEQCVLGYVRKPLITPPQ